MEVKRRTARALVQRLSTAAAGSETAAEAIAEIRLLSKDDPEIRAPLADAGAVPLLAAHLLHYPHHHDAPSADSQENAAAALLNLSISAREAVMSTPGILDALAAALRLPHPAPEHAATTLYSLLSVDTYRPIIGAKRSLIAALLDLLRAPSAPTRSVKDALKALFGLGLYPLNRAALVELGAVPPLFSLLVKDGRTGIVEDATAVIAQVAGCYESVAAFRRVAGVRILVDLVDADTGARGRARENAAAALLNLVMSGGDKATWDVMEVEGAKDAVRGLATGGEGVSARGKTKAEALLRVLESARMRPLEDHDDSDTIIDSSSSQVLHYTSSTVTRFG